MSPAPPLLAGLVALELGGPEGALCGRLLADLGMRVVKVEPPGGDPRRAEPPLAVPRAGDAGPVGAAHAFLDAGKQSVALDPTGSDGRAALRRLLDRADVVVCGGATPADILDEARQRARADTGTRPVVATVSGFGPHGPYAGYAAPDLVVAAMGGITWISGTPGEVPCSPPESQAHHLAGLWAAQAVCASLWRRHHGGVGAVVDVSAQAAVATLDQQIRSWAYDGVLPQRAGSQHPRVAPASVFPTADGFVHLYVSRSHWARFLAAWPDHPREFEDPEWADNDRRRRAADRINPLVEAFTRAHPTEDLVAALQGAGIPCLPVNTPHAFMDDPHVRDRGLFSTVTDPVLGPHRRLGPPFLLDGSRPVPGGPPVTGEHTGALLDTPDDRAATPALPVASAGGGEGPSGLLRGVRVLSLTTGIAGPRAGRSLAAWGADVIKLESANGGLDAFRYFSGRQARDPQGAPDDLNHSTRFIESNLGVRSVTVNLKDPAGVELALELVARSDVVLDNFRPGVRDRLGLGLAAIRAANPRAVVVSMPGLGSDGAKAGYGSWGPSVAAFSGLTDQWNHPGQPRPVGSQSVYPDYVASVLAPAVTAACLLHRERTGAALTVDLAQSEAVAYVLGGTYLLASLGGDPTPRGNRREHAVPSGLYRCAGDDAWCAVAVEDDARWRALCGVLGRPEAGNDPRYATRDARAARVEEIDGWLNRWMAGLDRHEAMRTLQAAGVGAGAVQTAADLAEDPQLAALGIVGVVDQPGLGPVPLPGLPVLVDDVPVTQTTPAPQLGQDNEAVLCDLLGHSRAELAAWVDSKVVW